MVELGVGLDDSDAFAPGRADLNAAVDIDAAERRHHLLEKATTIVALGHIEPALVVPLLETADVRIIGDARSVRTGLEAFAEGSEAGENV